MISFSSTSAASSTASSLLLSLLLFEIAVSLVRRGSSRNMISRFCMEVVSQTFYLKDTLHLGPAEMSALMRIFTLPWTIKPLYGFLKDLSVDEQPGQSKKHDLAVGCHR